MTRPAAQASLPGGVQVEFDNIAKAIAAHDTVEYQTALKVLAGGAERDIRIVEGVA